MKLSLSLLPAPQTSWLPRACLALGVGATIAMNVAAGTRGGLGGALIGALIPVAFVLALETLIWMVRQVGSHPWGWLWCVLAGLPLFLLAGVTGIVSYLHALEVARATASTHVVAYLVPLAADGLIVCASVALMAVSRLAGTEPEPASTTAAGKPGPRRRRPGPVPGTNGTKTEALAEELMAMPAGDWPPVRDWAREKGVAVVTVSRAREQARMAMNGSNGYG